MLGNGANDWVLGQIGLDDDLTRAIAASGTTGDLLQQIVGALPCSKIGQL